MEVDVTLVVNKIRASLEADNGCAFLPSPETLARLESAVRKAVEFDRIQFTREEIDMLVAGDQTDREAHFKGFATFPELDAAINEVFDSPTGCLHLVVGGGICLHCSEPAPTAS